MRIGIDCRTLQEPRPSGVSVYTRELVKAMVALPEAAQHEFVLFLNGHGFARSERAAELKQEISGENVEWRIGNVPNKFITGGELLLKRPRLGWMFGDIDVVFVPNIGFFPFTDDTVPLVLTMHDLSFERFPEFFGLKGRLWHRLLQPRTFVQKARHLIAVSEHTKSELVDVYGTDESSIEVIHPGLYALNTDARLPAHMQQPYILFLATVEPRKNLDTLLAAFQHVRKQHPAVSLVVAGAQKQAVPRQTGVHCIEYVDEATKWALLKNAEVFVYPSLYEGFGFPPLEAQAVGTPVVVGSHSSLPEVLGNSAMYVDVFDVHSIARAINHLLSDTGLANEYIQLGRENILRFQWKNAAQQTLNVLLSAHE